MVKTLSSAHSSGQVAGTPQPHVMLACTICSAQYAPTQAKAHLLQAPRIAAESAFMSMCHFCFRCRRPACPLCWDDVNGICGECVEAVHLSFRKDAAPLPLNSTLLVASPPALSVKARSAVPFPLVCVRPGRFYADTQSADAARVRRTPDKAPLVVAPQQKYSEPVQERVSPPIAPVEQGSVARRVERVITLFLGLLLFFIAVLILVASFSEQANGLIARLLHVDIRMEIEYLLQLIQQNH